ncbi:MAG TPA: GNAT family N-acetyltransferase [Anaerolineales bacterium]|jgi:ribosomal protein S18 acetylase RimI-like enzyme|nr:GNAT family N-acetyltransferase [Anaerolineales bacterium]
MHIQQAAYADQELWDAFQRLVPQLTSKNPPPSLDNLTALVRSESSTLFVARAEDDSIIGAACLTVYRVLTGIRAIIEDVIVDESARRQGVGEALVRRCLDLAREKGAAGVSLTSNPKREAANHMYVRMGFSKRETNAYYFKFS